MLKILYNHSTKVQYKFCIWKMNMGDLTLELFFQIASLLPPSRIEITVSFGLPILFKCKESEYITTTNQLGKFNSRYCTSRSSEITQR